jgi:protein-S-isoprenylcysteine O-methyltransferase Ste14
MLANWPGALASVALLLAAVIMRIRAEERALIAVLGEPYRAFAARRARLLPYIW